MEVSFTNAVCRCCLAGGSFKDLKGTYEWMGENEVYADMLKDCFDISLCIDSEGTSGSICEICVTQLRNAKNFKKQVLRSDEIFKKNLGRTRVKDEDVKVEFLTENQSEDVYHDDNFQFETVIEVPVVSDETPSNAKSRKRTKLPTKSTIKAKKAKVEPETSKQSAEEARKKRTKETRKKRTKKRNREDFSATPERIEHRVNLTTILQHSTATPFRDKTAKGFSCLYCCKYFKDIDDLRIHTAQQSEKDKMNSMIDYKLSYNPIKVDITNLACTVCDTEMLDLVDLKDHLVTTHNKTIYKDIKDIILPFRLESGNNFMCVICSVAHMSFKNLYHHMSSHYRNYCCEQCGAGYVTIAALRKHGKTHEDGDFQCDFCEKTYNSLSKKKQHEKGVHKSGWLRNKCPHCPEIFVSYYDRSDHLVKVHNETPVVYPCNACNKVYKKKFELNRHIKHHHLQQKNFKCDECNAKFFSSRGLKDHVVRHAGGEPCHPCEVCGKSFARMRTLKEHLRSHDEDKKFQCEVCKKTFAQKCSLKSHIRLHQDDLDIFKEFDDVKHLIDNRDITLKQIAVENKRKEAQEKAAGGMTVAIL